MIVETSLYVNKFSRNNVILNFDNLNAGRKLNEK